MPPRKCEWCEETFDDTNGFLTEDGKYACCSEECLNNLEENFAENEKEERNLAYRYRTGRT